MHTHTHTHTHTSTHSPTHRHTGATYAAGRHIRTHTTHTHTHKRTVHQGLCCKANLPALAVYKYIGLCQSAAFLTHTHTHTLPPALIITFIMPIRGNTPSGLAAGVGMVGGGGGEFRWCSIYRTSLWEPGIYDNLWGWACLNHRPPLTPSPPLLRRQSVSPKTNRKTAPPSTPQASAQAYMRMHKSAPVYGWPCMLCTLYVYWVSKHKNYKMESWAIGVVFNFYVQ